MKLIPLAVLARRLPGPSGNHIHPLTLLRWHLDGLKGGTVRLQAKKVGGRWCSTRQWLKAFLDACQSPVERTCVESPAEQDRRLKMALAEAEARGMR